MLTKSTFTTVSIFVAVFVLAVSGKALAENQNWEQFEAFHKRSFNLGNEVYDSSTQDVFNRLGNEMLDSATTALRALGQNVFGKGMRLNSTLYWTNENDIQGDMQMGLPLWEGISSQGHKNVLLMETGLALSQSTALDESHVFDQTDVHMGLTWRQQRGQAIFGLSSFYDTNMETELGRLGLAADVRTGLMEFGVGGYLATTSDWVVQGDYEYRIASGVDLYASYRPLETLRLTTSVSAWEDLERDAQGAMRLGAEVQGHWDVHPMLSLSAGYAYDAYGYAGDDITTRLELRYPPRNTAATSGFAPGDIYALSGGTPSAQGGTNSRRLRIAARETAAAAAAGAGGQGTATTSTSSKILLVSMNGRAVAESARNKQIDLLEGNRVNLGFIAKDADGKIITLSSLLSDTDTNMTVRIVQQSAGVSLAAYPKDYTVHGGLSSNGQSYELTITAKDTIVGEKAVILKLGVERASDSGAVAQAQHADIKILIVDSASPKGQAMRLAQIPYLPPIPISPDPCNQQQRRGSAQSQSLSHLPPIPPSPDPCACRADQQQRRGSAQSQSLSHLPPVPIRDLIDGCDDDDDDNVKPVTPEPPSEPKTPTEPKEPTYIGVGYYGDQYRARITGDTNISVGGSVTHTFAVQRNMVDSNSGNTFQWSGRSGVGGALEGHTAVFWVNSSSGTSVTLPRGSYTHNSGSHSESPNGMKKPFDANGQVSITVKNTRHDTNSASAPLTLTVLVFNKDNKKVYSNRFTNRFNLLPRAKPDEAKPDDRGSLKIILEPVTPIFAQEYGSQHRASITGGGSLAAGESATYKFAFERNIVQISTVSRPGVLSRVPETVGWSGSKKALEGYRAVFWVNKASGVNLPRGSYNHNGGLPAFFNANGELSINVRNTRYDANSATAPLSITVIVFDANNKMVYRNIFNNYVNLLARAE